MAVVLNEDVNISPKISVDIWVLIFSVMKDYAFFCLHLFLFIFFLAHFLLKHAGNILNLGQIAFMETFYWLIFVLIYGQ